MKTPAQKFDQWIRENPVKDSMTWKESAERQFARFGELADHVGEPLTVVGHHTSKSIKLPVVSIRVRNGWFLLRDNFYGVNLCCLWDFPPDLALDDLYKKLTYADYLDLVKKKRGYSYKGWTDEEMDDPRILRVKVPSASGALYWKNLKDGGEKDRWIARWHSTEWYSHDWSSGLLIPSGPRRPGGIFGPETVFYETGHAFAEGISSLVSDEALQPYVPGAQEFTFDLDGYDRARERMTLLLIAPERTKYGPA